MDYYEEKAKSIIQVATAEPSLAVDLTAKYLRGMTRHIVMVIRESDDRDLMMDNLDEVLKGGLENGKEEKRKT